MTPGALRTYLHDHIPLSRAMAVEVVEASATHVLLEAPLAPNINMHGTMFGGSSATLALLAAWSVMHLKLEAERIASQLVIHRTAMEYLLPVTGLAQASAHLDEVGWPNFLQTFHRRGRARLTIASELLFEGNIAGRITGEFVAISEA
ncbi:YiiD C-terminal domain-containing protein [Devosia sp.]|uniref:YiiD C-terminal domain-containing protein n=1 Tax=Devosia sp. TaxID=1871048 RepID=UPI001B13404B|nr:YiiD C-terminal domain-containing protein [Devosia sp.]MBO9587812.1 YiiD C-terminal domain-containing protein [Devosia sp.]